MLVGLRGNSTFVVDQKDQFLTQTKCPSNGTQYHKEVSERHLFILQNLHSSIGQCFRPYGVILEKALSY